MNTGSSRVRRFAATLRRAGVLTPGFALVASLGVAVPSASATAPSNDNWATATAVSSLAFRATVDTSDATTDTVNPPGTQGWRKHSVWFHLVLPANTRLLASTAGTNYSYHFLGLFHARSSTEPPDRWTKVMSDTSRSQEGAGFVAKVKGGEDYFIMISNSRYGAHGGIAKLLLRRPAGVTFKLAQDAVLDRADGAAVLKGTVKSTRPAMVRLSVTLRQTVGDRVVQATGFKTIEATRHLEPWVMRVAARRPFRLGNARISASDVQVYDQGILVVRYHVARTLVTLK